MKLTLYKFLNHLIIDFISYSKNIGEKIRDLVLIGLSILFF